MRPGNSGPATPRGATRAELPPFGSAGSDPSGAGLGTVEYEPTDDYYLLDEYDSTEADDGRRRVRVERRRDDHGGAGRHSRRRRGRKGFVALFAVLFLAILAVGTYLIVTPIYRYLNPDDYSGAGTGVAIVTVRSDDGASQIGTELHSRQVVASVRAFTNAASDDAKSKNIQPGTYRLHRHMSAKAALGLLLNPASRVDSEVLVTEGMNTRDVTKALIVPACGLHSPSTAKCGPGLTEAAARRALSDVKALGVPTEYTVNGRTPRSIEGFLFPATYVVPPRTTASDLLQQMVNNFTEKARETNFTASARALHVTPYEELIIASIAQGEAKYAADYPKVARVILNRLAARQPLQIDATSVYAAKSRGLDPSKTPYAQVDSPYNTYTHRGLPPTPIGNPGLEAMSGAAHPTVGGTWKFYVNGDAQGHLVFLNTEAQFEAARHRCHVMGWGCAGP